MKTLSIIILSMLLGLVSFAQETVKEQKNVGFALLLEQRITPGYLSVHNGSMTEQGMRTPVLYSEDDQLSGTAIGYEVSYRIKKINLSLIFSQSFRYDHIYFEANTLSVTDYSVNKSINDLITDYHFIVEKSFLLKNEDELNLRVGYSLMNRGTDYAYSKQNGEIEGQEFLSLTQGSFDFTAYQFSVGYERNRLGFTIGSYLTDEHNYNQPSKVLIPFVRLGYKLSLR